MNAFDSSRSPDPSQFLHPQTLDALRAALTHQRSCGEQPTATLADAVKAAALEARARDLTPESVIIQLKTMADEVGLAAPERGGGRAAIREWMVLACLRAYFSDAT
jgi:hypothetical protein